MNYKGKVVKKIIKLFPDEETTEQSIVKFFDYYYVTCGLSLKEIIDYVIGGSTHSVLSLIAKSYSIEYIASKGGNVYKYPKVMKCDCGKEQSLRLLVANKELHSNLILKCPKCIVGDMK